MAKGRLSQAGYNALKSSEGYIKKAYALKNSKTGYVEKYCTCCLGHYGPDVVCGKTYTDEECQALFARDSARFTNDVNKIFDTDKGMTQSQFDAMFSFAYNHGNISSTKLGETIVKNPKDYETIQKVWLSSYAHPGGFNLVPRRKREASTYCGPAYNSSLLPESSESGETPEGFSPHTEEFELEDVSYYDVSNALSDVDYGSLNQAQAFAVNQMDATYNAFNIIQDASNAVLGAKVLEISTFKHEGSAEDHRLITDDSVPSAIAQDEHSNKVKEDTDKADEAYYNTTDDKTKPAMPNMIVTEGFAI